MCINSTRTVPRTCYRPDGVQTPGRLPGVDKFRTRYTGFNTKFSLYNTRSYVMLHVTILYLSSMINSKEIRIGNFLLGKDRIDVITEVYSISESGINIFRDGDVEFAFWELEPIPLTEEWLLKFGFTKKMSYYSYNNFCIRVLKSGCCWVHYKSYSIIGSENSFLYVHQLQNLIFALTGKELEVKTLSQSPQHPGSTQ